MSDLQILTRNNSQLENLVKIVHKFKDIKISIKLCNCDKPTIRKSKLAETENIK